MRRDISWGLVAITLALSALGCAKTEYVGNNAKDFWSDNPAEISPTQAYQKALPHLDVTWEARCDQVRNHDEYCDKLPLDHMVRRGKWYFVTRTSYPYKNYDALTQYAVKVSVDKGEVVPFEYGGGGGEEAAESEE